MMKKNRPTDDSNLAARLRLDAERDAAAFSIELQARIMNDVRTAPGQKEARPNRPGYRFLLAGALAAAVVLVAFGLMRRATDRTPGPEIPIATHPEPPTFPRPVDIVNRTVAPARDELSAVRFAYLDRDAKRLAEFFIEQIPRGPEVR